jgi:hypothetical protein
MAKRKTITQLSDLTPDAANANKGTERGRYMVEASLTETGAGRSIVADKDGRIIAGNKTLEAWAGMGGAVKIVETDGQELVVVQRTDLDLSDPKGKARKLAYYDNRAGQVGLEWDAEQLLADVNAGVDLAAMFKADEIAELLAGVKGGDADAEPQIDQAEELNKKWQVKTGDLWRIGAHRLLCGDSTKAADVTRVMGGEKAALMVTSPPYGVGKDYEVGGLAEWEKTIAGMLGAAGSPLAAINLCDVKVAADHREAHTYGRLIDLCAGAGLPLIGTRIWAKQPAWAQGPYWLSSYRAVDDFEYIGIFGDAPHTERTAQDWRYRGVWEIASVGKNDVHSAMFPVELPTRLITLLCDRGRIVYEPFAGSGTTLVACENLGRKCRAVEISPAYCAVILERMAQAFPKLEITRDDGAG